MQYQLADGSHFDPNRSAPWPACPPRATSSAKNAPEDLARFEDRDAASHEARGVAICCRRFGSRWKGGGRRVRDERARADQTDSERGDQLRSPPRVRHGATETAGVGEHQRPGADELEPLRPAAFAERERGHRLAHRVVALAPRPLDGEHRDEQRSGDRPTGQQQVRNAMAATHVPIISRRYPNGKVRAGPVSIGSAGAERQADRRRSVGPLCRNEKHGWAWAGLRPLGMWRPDLEDRGACEEVVQGAMSPVNQGAQEVESDEHPDHAQDHVERGRRPWPGERELPDRGMGKLPRRELEAAAQERPT